MGANDWGHDNRKTLSKAKGMFGEEIRNRSGDMTDGSIVADRDRVL
jgi:hypothetical protein